MTEIPKDLKLNTISVFEHYHIDVFEAGHVLLSTEIHASALNYYGNAHGGFLFTLCDQVGGLVAKSIGLEAVTLQANVNYLKPSHLGDRLVVEGSLVHRGRTTQLIEVTIKNQDDRLLTRVSLTMFVTSKKRSSD